MCDSKHIKVCLLWTSLAEVFSSTQETVIDILGLLNGLDHTSSVIKGSSPGVTETELYT
jgi:hypothetical protein